MTLYRAVRAAIVVVSRSWFRLSINGAERVPREGAFVLAPVHRSFIDFALVCAVTRRRLRYMGKDSLWKFKPFGWLLGALGAFPVHRGTADREAVRRSIELAEQGEPLVIFPEGTRRSGPVVQDLFEGAAYVAAKAGVPIVPIGIGGSEEALPKGRRLPRPGRIHIEVGEPIPAPAVTDGGRVSRRAVHTVTEQLHGEIQRLFDLAQTRVG